MVEIISRTNKINKNHRKNQNTMKGVLLMMKLIKKNSIKNQDFVIDRKMMMNYINKTSFKIIR